MDSLRLLLSVTVLLAMIGFLGAQATKSTKPEGRSSKAGAAKPTEAKPVDKKTPVVEETAAENEAGRSDQTTDGHESDREGIVSITQVYVAAYNKGDAATAANCLTANAEYVDESGEVIQGRKTIHDILAQLFEEDPGRQLELNIESIRFVDSGVAIVDGQSTLEDSEGTVVSYHRYSVIHVKVDDQWLMASVRDRAPKDRREHRLHLEQLSWLLGDWIDESPDAVVVFSCVPSDDGNFLIRTFTEQQAGEPLYHGTQWIGWDPLNHQLRSWTFDSEGGFSSGVWYHDDENWLLKSTGVTADGEASSSTTIFSFVNDHQMNWQVVGVEVEGVAAPDGDVISIVARPPSPELATPAENAEGDTDQTRSDK